MACGCEGISSGTEGCFVDIGQHYGGTCLGEGLRGGQAHSGAGAGDQGNLAGQIVTGVHAKDGTAGEPSTGMPCQYTFHQDLPPRRQIGLAR